ncbi:MAG: 50S ribosomal protein L17 [Elusimicrobia bacterium]|nr:50S ribosomal protein L17 [Elusimicrobiota bacterium]
MIKTYARRKLGVRPAHRKMMMRQLAVSLIHHEKITTTGARAKELKVYAERMISRLTRLKDPLRQARQAARWLAPNGLDVSKKLRETIVPRYRGKTGGYLRITALPPRRSDRACLSRVELV